MARRFEEATGVDVDMSRKSTGETYAQIRAEAVKPTGDIWWCGTADTALTTIVQLFGEDDGFEFMKGLHANINQYTKSGTAPIKAAAQGETVIAIAFMLDAVQQAVAGYPIEVVAPGEGTGYGIGSMSIIEGARNLDEAKTFYDWALTGEVQALGLEVNAFQAMSNGNAATSDIVPDPASFKLIDHDFAKYGSSEERRRLLQKWDEDVSTLPH